MSKNESQTNFGFKQVDINEKKNLVGKIFSDVAEKYDLMNDVMSLGVHRLWKEEFCKRILNFDSKILDVAGGTGDIALKINSLARMNGQNPHIVICDINQEMLNVAEDKAVNQNLFDNIEYVCADAENLPFEDDSFDYYTIAFGIRNVTRIDMALKEAHRVLKKGGKFLCLEFSSVQESLLKKFYDLYAFNVIPKMGKLITGDDSPYQYLVESIALFPDQDSFLEMIKEVGFKNASYQNLTFGVAAIHSAVKI